MAIEFKLNLIFYLFPYTQKTWRLQDKSHRANRANENICLKLAVVDSGLSKKKKKKNHSRNITSLMSPTANHFDYFSSDRWAVICFLHCNDSWSTDWPSVYDSIPIKFKNVASLVIKVSKWGRYVTIHQNHEKPSFLNGPCLTGGLTLADMWSMSEKSFTFTGKQLKSFFSSFFLSLLCLFFLLPMFYIV